MARTKKITDAQRAGLNRLCEGPADYYELARAGARGATIKWLSNKGLVDEDKDESGGRVWTITDAGKAVHKAGCIRVL